MRNLGIIIAIVTVFFIIGCRGAYKKDANLELLMSSPIHLPLSEMEKFNNNSLEDNQEATLYKLIHFVDTQSCSICELKALYQWDDLLIKNNMGKLVQLCYIIEAGNHNREDLINAINETYYQGDVYLDSLGVFLKHNTNIPSNRLYHTFLLDKNNNVVLVGNPLNNTYVEELLVKTVDNMNRNNGVFVPDN
jgi:hypothetical protein